MFGAGRVPSETEVQLYHLTSRRGFPVAYGDNIQDRPAEEALLSWWGGGEAAALTVLEEGIGEDR